MITTLCHMTSGATAAIAESAKLAQWATLALRAINPDGYPDMIVGRPGARERTLEDGGRTLVLPLPENCPKVYAIIGGETGTPVIMLADEY